MSKDVDSELEWGAVGSNINETASIAEKLGREDVIAILEDAFSEFEKFEDKTEIFEHCYEFSFHMRYRKYTEADKSDQGRNKITLSEPAKHAYRITDYDFKMFMWAKKHGLGNSINNNYIDVPSDKLTDKEKQEFDARVKR